VLGNATDPRVGGLTKEEVEAIRKWRQRMGYREHVPHKFRAKPGERMHVITVHLPWAVIDKLERLVQQGYYASRAEFIRTAVGRMLAVEEGELR